MLGGGGGGGDGGVGVAGGGGAGDVTGGGAGVMGFTGTTLQPFIPKTTSSAATSRETTFLNTNMIQGMSTRLSAGM